MRFRCLVCGWIYDENKEGKPFDDLPEDWRCPVCLASHDNFELIDENCEGEIQDLRMRYQRILNFY